MNCILRLRKTPARFLAKVTVMGLLWLVALGLLVPYSVAQATGRGDRIEVEVNIPKRSDRTSTTDYEIDNAEFRWGINVETHSGAFFGGCNWVQAGEAGNWGRSEVWTDDRFWSAREGNVRIEKPGPNGQMVQPTWNDKCQDLSGPQPRTVTTQENHESGLGTRAEVVIEGGTGSYDAETDTLRVEWEGSFTVVFYGGMTYWWARNPVVEVRNGVGTVTADLGGYGADMHDTSRWEVLPVHEDVTMADLSGVEIAHNATGFPVGFQHRPQYEAVMVHTVAVGPSQPQNRELDQWGSFPQEFVDFQVLTGQAGYWYTTGGLRDLAKPPHEVIVSFDASAPLEADRVDATAPPPSGVPGQPQLPGLPAQPGSVGGAGSSTGSSSQGSGDGGWSGGAGGAGFSGSSGGITTVLPDSYEPLDLSSLLAALASNSAPIAAPAPAEGAEAWHTGEQIEPQDIDWLGTGLIPDGVTEFIRDNREMFWWALAGLLVLGTVTFLAYRRGWLVVPWAK